MKQSIWCMHDKRAGIYHEPVMYRNDEIAQISLKRSVMQDLENGNISHSILSEFEFVKLAEFNDRDGVYAPIPHEQRQVVPLNFGDDE